MCEYTGKHSRQTGFQEFRTSLTSDRRSDSAPVVERSHPATFGSSHDALQKSAPVHIFAILSCSLTSNNRNLFLDNSSRTANFSSLLITAKNKKLLLLLMITCSVLLTRISKLVLCDFPLLTHLPSQLSEV